MGFDNEKLKNVLAKIKDAAVSVNRSPADITLIAVTKTIDIQTIKAAIAAGISVIGENRVQEAEAKWREIGTGVKWHLVGHLQTNKVKKAVRMFDLIHSVDSLKLAQEVDRRAREAGKVQDILVQVNTSGEDSKFGVAPEATADLVCAIKELSHVEVRGLMTIGAFLPGPEAVRPCFKLLRSLQETIRTRAGESIDLGHLSMGMTNDYEAAVQEGATLVRVGRALFGERS